MVEFLVILTFLLFCGAAVCVWVATVESRRSVTDAVRAELLSADQRVDTEYHQARRAMNDAAGQSWRNLAG